MPILIELIFNHVKAMVPSPAELSYFLEVALTQNISRASERLGISQPSLSLAIKKLEEHLGTPLLIRSSTGVKLTKVGQRFQSKARILLDQWSSVMTEVKRDEKEIAGCYQIGAHVSVACGRLAMVLPNILEQYPQLEIHMHHDLSRRINEKVINFELDFGVVVNPLRHPDLVVRPLYGDEVRFYAHPQHSLQNKSGLLLCYDPELSQGRFLLKEARERGVEFRRYLVSSSLEVIAAMAAQGAGICILPGYVARTHPELVPIWPELPAFSDVHTLVYRADSQCSTAAKALAMVLAKGLNDNSLAKK